MNFVAALLYAVSSSTLLAVALAFFRGSLSPADAGAALGVGLLVASWTLWEGRNRSRSSRPPGPWEWAAIVAFALISLRIFLWVVFIDGDEIKVLSPNNLGDLSLHLTYLRYLANGAPFWPDNPIFTGGKLTYPVGVDLFHSLLTLLGVDALRGFVWIGLAGSALTGAALWRWGRGFALLGFLGNGGFAAAALFWNWRLVDFQADFAWKSIALALFATQRGLLFALPAGLLLLGNWRARFFSAEDDDGWRLPRWGEVLLYASLPLFHFHTFLFLSVLLAAWFVGHASARRELIRLVGAAFIPAAALVLLVTGGLKGGRMLGWKPGWMWDDAPFLQWCGQHFGEPARLYAALAFWPLNFGVLPLFIAALIVVLLRRARTTGARAVVFPALLIFLVCCFVKFAPWEWDNTKLMLWSYLAVLPFLWTELLANWPGWARGAACAALFGSGFLSTLGGLDATHRGHSIASRAELDGVAYAVSAISITERFAGAPTYNHPLLLCGRKMALGYLGHVASHGLAWEAPAAKLEALMNGDATWRELAGELDCRYLFWGHNEAEAYPNSSQPWRETTRLLASGEWGAIYDLRSAMTPPSASPPVSE
jgi:hypothetical protein